MIGSWIAVQQFHTGFLGAILVGFIAGLITAVVILYNFSGVWAMARMLLPKLHNATHKPETTSALKQALV